MQRAATQLKRALARWDGVLHAQMTFDHVADELLPTLDVTDARAVRRLTEDERAERDATTFGTGWLRVYVGVDGALRRQRVEPTAVVVRADRLRTHEVT